MTPSDLGTPPDEARHLATSDLITSKHVNNALRGDRESLDWVVTRFTPLLKAQASWRLGPLRNQCAPEDVVAEAWLVVLRQLDDLVHQEGRSTPRLIAFLGTTILNIANHRIDAQLRRAAVQLEQPPSSGDDPGLRALVDTATGAVTRAARNEAAAAVEAALGELSDADREVVILRIVEGRSNQETALMLGEMPNTASHRYQRALTRLRKALPESFFADFESA